jgi:hypothetical protein
MENKEGLFEQVNGVKEEDYNDLDLNKLTEDINNDKEFLNGGDKDKSIKERNLGFMNTLDQQAKEFNEKNPDFDMLTITKRLEGMSWELYKFIRKISNKTLRNYVRRK